MIVCMNYDTSGNRYIAKIIYRATMINAVMAEKAQILKDAYDEVYIINFDNTHEGFIQEIVLKGCRL